MAENQGGGENSLVKELMRSGAIPVREAKDSYGDFVQLQDDKAAGSADWNESHPSPAAEHCPVDLPGPAPKPEVCPMGALPSGEAAGRSVTVTSGERITPLEDRLVVKPDEADQVTKGGILLPDVAKERPMRGTVIAAGPGRRTELTGVLVPTEVKVGQRVLFARYQGEVIKSGDAEYRILREKDVSAVLG
jgi:chaperonin GroES